MEHERIVQYGRGCVGNVLVLAIEGAVDREADVHEGGRELDEVRDDEVHVDGGAHERGVDGVVRVSRGFRSVRGVVPNAVEGPRDIDDLVWGEEAARAG